MKIIIFTLNSDQLVAVPEDQTLAFLKQYVGNVKSMNECTFIKMEPATPPAQQEEPAPEQQEEPAPEQQEEPPAPRRRARRTSSRNADTVGAYIKSKRKDKSITQADLSILVCSSENQDVHITQERVSRIERGKSKATVKQFMFICTEIFDISQDDALELVSKYRTELK